MKTKALFCALWIAVCGSLAFAQQQRPSTPTITIASAQATSGAIQTYGAHELLVQFAFGTVAGSYTGCTVQANTSLDGTNYFTFGPATAITVASNTAPSWRLTEAAGSGSSTTAASALGLWTTFTFNCSAFGTSAPATISVIAAPGGGGLVSLDQTGTNNGVNVTNISAQATGAQPREGADATIPAVSPSTLILNAVTGNATGTAFDVTGYAGAGLTVNCSSCSGGTTVTFYISEDATNYVPHNATQVGARVISTSTVTSGITEWQISVAGFRKIRADVSNYSAGTITVTATATAGDYVPKTVNVIPAVTATGSEITTYADVGAAATTISSSAATLYSISADGGTNTADLWVELFNAASGSVTLGTTAPKLIYKIPGGTGPTGGANNPQIPIAGIPFDTAMSWACVTAPKGASAAGSNCTITVGKK